MTGLACWWTSDAVAVWTEMVMFVCCSEMSCCLCLLSATRIGFARMFRGEFQERSGKSVDGEGLGAAGLSLSLTLVMGTVCVLMTLTVCVSACVCVYVPERV